MKAFSTLFFTCFRAEVSGRTEPSRRHVRLPDADAVWLHRSNLRLSLRSAQRARPTPCCLVSRVFQLHMCCLTNALIVCFTDRAIYCGSELILLPQFEVKQINQKTSFIFSPFSSDRQHLSYDDCLEVRGEIIRTVLCCIVY